MGFRVVLNSKAYTLECERAVRAVIGSQNFHMSMSAIRHVYKTLDACLEIVAQPREKTSLAICKSFIQCIVSSHPYLLHYASVLLTFGKTGILLGSMTSPPLAESIRTCNRISEFPRGSQVVNWPVCSFAFQIKRNPPRDEKFVTVPAFFV